MKNETQLKHHFRQQVHKLLHPIFPSPIVSKENEESLDDYYNYDYDLARDEPTSRQDWFDLRTRRKRQAPEEPKKENTLLYTVCVRYATILISFSMEDHIHEYYRQYSG